MPSRLLLRTITVTSRFSSTNVANSCTFIKMEPSPLTHTVRRPGATSAPPMAAGSPKPIVPSPPEVRYVRGRRTG